MSRLIFFEKKKTTTTTTNKTFFRLFQILLGTLRVKALIMYYKEITVRLTNLSVSPG